MRIILLKGKDIYNIEDETNSTRKSDEYQSQSCEDTYPYSLELLLMINSNQLGTTHRENIFQTNCQTFNKNCSLIVDSGSCYKFCSI